MLNLEQNLAMNQNIASNIKQNIQKVRQQLAQKDHDDKKLELFYHHSGSNMQGNRKYPL